MSKFVKVSEVKSNQKLQTIRQEELGKVLGGINNTNTGISISMYSVIISLYSVPTLYSVKDIISQDYSIK